MYFNRADVTVNESPTTVLKGKQQRNNRKKVKRKNEINNEKRMKGKEKENSHQQKKTKEEMKSQNAIQSEKVFHFVVSIAFSRTFFSFQLWRTRNFTQTKISSNGKDGKRRYKMVIRVNEE